MAQVPLIGLIASMASSASLFPSIHKAVKENTVTHIALPSLLITAIASICWLIYAWYNNIILSMVSSTVILISTIILGFLLYKHRNKKMISGN